MVQRGIFNEIFIVDLFKFPEKKSIVNGVETIHGF